MVLGTIGKATLRKKDILQCAICNYELMRMKYEN